MTTLPYGSWPSPLHASDLAGASVRLSEVEVQGSDTFWTEGRASEQGRTVLLRRGATGETSRVSPEQAPDGGTFDVRSRAQEYGGGTFAVAADIAVASRKEDDRLYRFALDGSGALPLTPADGGRYGDLAIDLERGLVYAVLEDHGEPGGFRTDPTTTLVAVPLDGSAAETRAHVRTVFSGTDFVNAPRLSLDGHYLAFVTWDHPNMPWDGSTVRLGELTADGTLRSPALTVAGGEDVSAQEPVWTPAGDLVHVDDSSGWWNLYRTELSTPEGWLELRTRHLHPAQVEFSAPQWVFGPRTIAVLDEDHLVLSWVEEGRRRLGTMRLLNGELEAWVGDWEPAGAIAAAPDRVVFVGAHARRPGAVVELELEQGTTTVLASSTSLTLDEASVSEAEPVSWDAGDGVQAHGFYYPPALADTAGPDGELPPLLVMIHGGPTSATSPGFAPGLQYWTTRGFAVLDVNYGGSTGYGRAYRERLDGAWGLVDVADCATGASAMAATGRADGNRLAIRGGSAGGFTTLAALAFTDTFAAGTSRYGIGDLAALAAETHKFEARYLDRLVGPYPEAEAVYAERSPLEHVDQITAPVLLLQGSEDRVVPPSQSSGMAQALRDRGVPVAYVELEGEGHGFRGADAITLALETELGFYGQVLGFEVADSVPDVDLGS